MAGYHLFDEARQNVTSYIVDYYSQLRPHQHNSRLNPKNPNGYFGKNLKPWPLFVDHYIDRLARNMNDLTNIVATIESKGASLEILDQRIDTGTASGKAFLQMLGVFAEFETNLRKERQFAGIAKAKRERPEAYQGKKTTTASDRVKELLAKGLKPSDVARKLGIGRATVYRHR